MVLLLLEKNVVRSHFVFVLILGWLLSPSLGFADEIQPHRAYYTVSMISQPSIKSTVTDVRGTMMLELSKVCGGWTSQQVSDIWKYMGEDEVEHIRWGYVTFESDNSSLFKFNTFRKVDDDLVEDIRGKAKKDKKIAEVIYQNPMEKRLKLSEGTLFPLEHIKGLLAIAEQGEHLYPAIVFDGSSMDGASEINTFIGGKKVQAGNPSLESTHQFAGQPFWPVRFSVYGSGGIGYEAEYTTTQELLPNGIIKQYVIDDGIIKIRGVLDRIELLPKEDC
ncbi:MAG: hypothetical protein A2X70_01400 [Alphaproteobacteria bacterium GWC2_42_16]|nr:MAG: hypothetical protein A2X70_01400 [Alphaproteobacteria bacterium GWC2_42_16]OFW81637.1 MAG: hypothetical protein A3E50_00030 [Alphaproteobacteria bacterium RIFCSPHIGHO2_12_FULL_42_100]OFW85279.1 MAG: hypothetical protein A2W06_00155 [Alphaproteobacteria bacterium RBG_16_42_14]OFW90537.1 MAG: hypothetical protein A3C41_02620 [Alphaproteobacteria bacterium RIFCSPHIGHO2_02_FULL_42_30]